MGFLKRFAIYLALFTGLAVFSGASIAIPAFIIQHFGEVWGLIMVAAEVVILFATLLAATDEIL